MAIEMKGRLDSASLGEIFKVLTDQPAACSLLVSDGVSEKIFYFSIGGLRLVSLGGRRAIPIGEVLVQAKKLTPKQRDEILARAKETGRRFGEAGVELGCLGDEDVAFAIRSQVEAELCDLVLWEDAEYEFAEGQPPEQFYDSRYVACSLSVDIPEFVAGVRARVKRLEEIRRRIASDREVLEPIPGGDDGAALDPAEAAARILPCVDGQRRVSEIVAETGLGTLIVYEGLARLIEAGYVRRPKPHEATAQLTREELLAEIEKLERARSELVGDSILRTRLAKAYEQIGDQAKAAGIWKEIAQLARRNNDLRQCMDALRNAARCVPLDFRTREQILDLHRANKAYGKLVEEGKSLAEAFLKNNLLNRARNLLGALVKIAPQDSRLLKLYALTLLGLGDREGALAQLMALAALLEKEPERVEELKEVYRRILALDRGRRDIRHKLIDVTGGRRHVWLYRAAIAAGVLALVGGVAAFAYEVSARRYYSHGIDLDRLLMNQEFGRAREFVSRVQKKYPWSTVAGRATDLLERIDAAEAEYFRHGVEADLSTARWALSHQEGEKAVKLYTRLSRLDPSASPSVREAVAESRNFLDQEAEIGRRLAVGRSFADQREVEKAHRVYESLASQYPDSPTVRAIPWPVEIRTVPAGARIFVNGVEKGRSPRVVTYPLVGKTRIRTELDGFTPGVIDVKKPLESTVRIVMRRETRWVFEGEGPFESSPVLAGDTLYLTGRDRYLYAIRAEDGKLRFRTCLGVFGDSAAAPAVVGQVVVVGTNRGELVGVETGSGAVVWRRDTGSAVVADLVADPDGSRVFGTLANGKVLAFRPADGLAIWSRDTRAAPSSGPALGKSLVYVGSYERKALVALDPAEGREVWSAPVGGPVSGPAVVGGDLVCFGSDDHDVYAVDTKTGGARRPFALTSMVKARPAVDGAAVYCGAMDGRFFCFPLTASGPAAWQKDLGHAVLATPALCAGRIYVGTTGGELYCLDAKKGTTEWIFPTGGKIVSRPLVRNQTVYLSSMDGRVYAIRQ